VLLVTSNVTSPAIRIANCQFSGKIDKLFRWSAAMLIENCLASSTEVGTSLAELGAGVANITIRECRVAGTFESLLKGDPGATNVTLLGNYWDTTATVAKLLWNQAASDLTVIGNFLKAPNATTPAITLSTGTVEVMPARTNVFDTPQGVSVTAGPALAWW
jgi:hypothetical protein